MPELPEVETIISSLGPQVSGRKITWVEIFLEKVIKEPAPAQFIKQLADRLIMGLKRRGKYILFEVDEGMVLVVHLRLTGQLVYVSPETPLFKHTHVIFCLDNGFELRFQDLRQFGTIHLIPSASLKAFRPLALLGPDALDLAFTRDLFEKQMKGKKRQVKKLLLDQTFVAGIGNIYADEILWQARVHPERPLDTLSSREIGRLYKAMREVLNCAIASRGTTLRNYVDGDGQPGGYQELLKVHAREGQLCPRCGNQITRLRNFGRSSYLCPYCQK